MAAAGFYDPVGIWRPPVIVRRKKNSYLLLVLPILGSGALLLGPLAGAGAAAP
ncbi:MAG: hypothetical protein QOG34_645, partial [Frankiaceae bacterium]|nr:hypothetical protein [Frankiaceae bacterium]